MSLAGLKRHHGTTQTRNMRPNVQVQPKSPKGRFVCWNRTCAHGTRVHAAYSHTYSDQLVGNWCEVPHVSCPCIRACIRQSCIRDDSAGYKRSCTPGSKSRRYREFGARARIPTCWYSACALLLVFDYWRNRITKTRHNADNQQDGSWVSTFLPATAANYETRVPVQYAPCVRIRRYSNTRTRVYDRNTHDVPRRHNVRIPADHGWNATYVCSDIMDLFNLGKALVTS